MNVWVAALRSGIVVSMVAGLGLAAGGPASAGATDGYSHDRSIGLTSTDWMRDLDGDLPISALSIPATHDSGASRAGGDTTVTQSLTLADQLTSGIRGWDVRLGVESGRLTIYHGPIRQGQDFDAGVLAVADRFLAAHPGETILMRIRHENGPATDFPDLVKNTIAGYGRIYRGSSDDPRLDDVRGKIVVLQDFTASYDTGIPWSSLIIQDEFRMGTNWGLAGKWRAISRHLDATRAGPRDRIHVNFLSASTGSFPYFVASGHSSSGTGAPQLLTGMTRGVIDTCRNNSRCIPEFPSVNCFLGTCSVAFQGTNVITMNTLRARGGGIRAGIVYADFPGRGLIQAVIDANPTPRP